MLSEDRARLELEPPELLVEDDSPVTSVGCRSGVHWIREESAPPMLVAIARAKTVFAVPGMSSSRTCPPEISVASTSRTSSDFPCTTCSTFAASRAESSIAFCIAGSSPDVLRGSTIVASYSNFSGLSRGLRVVTNGSAARFLGGMND